MSMDIMAFWLILTNLSLGALWWYVGKLHVRIANLERKTNA